MLCREQQDYRTVRSRLPEILSTHLLHLSVFTLRIWSWSGEYTLFFSPVISCAWPNVPQLKSGQNWRRGPSVRSSETRPRAETHRHDWASSGIVFGTKKTKKIKQNKVQPQEGEKSEVGGGCKPNKKSTSSASCLLFFSETLHCTYREIIQAGKYASCQAALARG